MSDKHVLEELSAYIDGEARHPERIARHLQQCEACARRHIELLRLAQHLRALSPPEPRPEFVTRVMARVRAQEAAPQGWRWAWTVPAAAFSTALLLVFSLYVYSLAPQPPPQVAQGGSAPQSLDESRIIAQVETLLQGGQDISILEMPVHALDSLETPGEAPWDEFLDQVALAAALDSPFDDFADEDLDDLIQGLHGEEFAAFHDLVMTYMNQG